MAPSSRLTDESLTDRGYLLTEQANPASQQLDQLSPLAFVDLVNAEDHQTLTAIADARADLAQAIDLIAKGWRQGGRLFYVGAGTSGRLGVLDASECPPTFCTPPELVQGVIAGGPAALVRSSEGLEDIAEDGAAVIRDRQIQAPDVVVGITAGGTTPYVHGALQAAQQTGATAILMTCVPREQVPADYDGDIRLLVGPEVLAGSTRLKAGTATKMALNILSTGAMVQLGKVHDNRMVDVSVTNAKLRDRAIRILCDLADLERSAAATLLDQSGQQVKLALLMHWSGLPAPEAARCLAQHQGHLRNALKSWNSASEA
ncbi:MAG: N-acetylmuramic acid 6-phosphate etherase [Leptolyngbyaceae cyanobacterium]